MTHDPENGLAPDSGERYERGSRIASGGMGEVWRARDTVLGREVAVKILKREFADDPTFRARFAAEARHAAGLHHPGIAAVFDYGLLQDAETPYLVMELVDGKPLSDLLADGTPVDPEQARLLALQTAEALAVAHDAGVVHRDVKPGNLLVTPDGQVKITDFGIARATGSVAFTQTGQIVGTPHYLSPEQARGAPATAASDVYALGVVLFECLSGHRLFDADTPIATALAHIQQEVPPLPDTIPPALAAVVQRSLAKDPAERYADGNEVAEALRGAAPGAAPTAAAGASAVAAVGAYGATQVLGPTTSVVDPVAADPGEGDDPAPGATPVTGSRSRRAALWIAGALGLLLLLALLVTRPWADDSTATGDAARPSTDAQTDSVRVRKADYVGEPVADVEQRLKDKDLRTTTDTVENDGSRETGTIADLSPTGLVAKGTRITLRVWGEAPAEEQTIPGEPTEPASPETSASEEPSQEADTGDTDSPEPGKPEKTAKPPRPEKTAPPGNPDPSGAGGSNPAPSGG